MTPDPPAGPTSVDRLTLLAPAKINLHLRVGPRRGDGFHPLLTWMCTVGLFDTLVIDRAGAWPAATGSDPAAATQDPLPAHGQGGPTGNEGTRAGPAPAAGATLTTDDPRLPTGAGNLVVRATTALADTLVIADRFGEGLAGDDDAARRGPADPAVAPTYATAPGVPPARGRVSAFLSSSPAAPQPVRGPCAVRIALHKRIPTGAGLGGGSSDAARTLLGLDRLWDARLPRDELAAIAARLGSDVPFFIHGPSCVCRGRGEIVRPIPAPAVARWAVLLLPEFAMPTPAVYRRFDEMGPGSNDAVARDEPDWNAWAALGAEALLPRLVNDLEPPAFALEPALGRLRADAEALLCRPVRMSGSGSSLFTLYDRPDDAEQAADRVSRTLSARAVAVELVPALSDDLS